MAGVCTQPPGEQETPREAHMKLGLPSRHTSSAVQHACLHRLHHPVQQPASAPSFTRRQLTWRALHQLRGNLKVNRLEKPRV